MGHFDCCELSWAETKLKGLVVWVTGASSGIGEELAYQLARCGSRLILSARREDELKRVKHHCLGKILSCHCPSEETLPLKAQQCRRKHCSALVTFLFSLIQLRPDEFCHLFFKRNPASRMRTFSFYHLICWRGHRTRKKRKPWFSTLGT